MLGGKIPIIVAKPLKGLVAGLRHAAQRESSRHDVSVPRKASSAKSVGSGIDGASRMYVRTLVSVMPWRVALALVLTICVSATEGVGVVLLIPFLQLVGLEVQQGFAGQLAELISTVFAAVGLRPTLITVLGLYAGTISAQALLRRWQMNTSGSLSQDFTVYLRRRLYKAIANTTWLFFSKNRSSDFAHMLTTEATRVGAGTTSLLSLLSGVAMVLIYLLFSLRLSVGISLLALICGIAIVLLLKKRMQVARTSGRELSQASREMHAAVIEHLAGMKVAKSYGAEGRNSEMFSEQAERTARKSQDAIRNRAEVRQWYDIGLVLILSLVLYIAIEIVTVSTATILLLLFMFARIMPKFSQLQQSYLGYINMLPAFAAVMETLTRCEAAAELEEVGQAENDVELRREIRFEGVSFAYGEKRIPAVEELDLTIRVGETTAIVGPSGAGKSTVADLVMGLLEPSRGRILVDEVPLGAERMRSWRSQVGYVAQDTFLFNDTVRANLLWACPEANDEDLVQALRLAAAEGFVSKLPDGMETVLGDRGVRLSGGERQRLALARALLRKPSLLILDEATSALDSENENRIQNAIERLHGRTTILVITHRLSTIRGADVIYVLDGGSLVESGDWSTLSGTERGRFSVLARAQGA